MRRKFNYLVHAKPNIFDPDCPWQVRVVKTLFFSIRTKTELETESTIENIDSSETEDNDMLIESTETPIFDVSTIDKIINHKIIDVSKTKIGTAVHIKERKKRKFLLKISKVLNFDDIPLGSLSMVDKKLIHGSNESADNINHMVQYIGVRDVRIETRNVKGDRR